MRTLSGDAPLPVDLEALAAQHRDVDALGEQKRRVLRALKDLEGERALGKIDDADYEAIAMQYREEAKALMREMDRNVAPALAEAERIAREYLAAQGLGAGGEGARSRGGRAPPAPARTARVPRAARRRTSPTPRFARSAGGDEDGGGSSGERSHATS